MKALIFVLGFGLGILFMDFTTAQWRHETAAGLKHFAVASFSWAVSTTKGAAKGAVKAASGDGGG